MWVRRSYCSGWCQSATFASSVNGKTESTGVEATAVTKAEIVRLVEQVMLVLLLVMVQTQLQ